MGIREHILDFNNLKAGYGAPDDPASRVAPLAADGFNNRHNLDGTQQHTWGNAAGLLPTRAPQPALTNDPPLFFLRPLTDHPRSQSITTVKNRVIKLDIRPLN